MMLKQWLLDTIKHTDLPTEHVPNVLFIVHNKFLKFTVLQVSQESEQHNSHNNTLKKKSDCQIWATKERMENVTVYDNELCGHQKSIGALLKLMWRSEIGIT